MSKFKTDPLEETFENRHYYMNVSLSYLESNHYSSFVLRNIKESPEICKQKYNYSQSLLLPKFVEEEICYCFHYKGTIQINHGGKYRNYELLEKDFKLHYCVKAVIAFVCTNFKRQILFALL